MGSQRDPGLHTKSTKLRRLGRQGAHGVENARPGGAGGGHPPQKRPKINEKHAKSQFSGATGTPPPKDNAAFAYKTL